MTLPSKYKRTHSLEDPWADYSWTETLVYQRDDGARFWAQDSGCSCNYPGQDLIEGDLQPLPNRAAFRQILLDQWRNAHPPDRIEKFLDEVYAADPEAVARG